MNNPEWTPPPPPQENESFYSAGTREHAATTAGSKATQAIIFGILSILFCPLIFGILGLRAANEALENIDIYDVAHDKRGMATAGKVLSVIGMVLWGIGLVLRLIGAAM